MNACHVLQILGAEDAFLWQIVGLRASTNNKMGTVLDLFLDAVAEYSVPS